VDAAHEAAARMSDARIDRNTLEEAYRLACDRLEPH